MIRHLVLFTFDDQAGDAEQELTAALRALPDQVPEIIELSLDQPINDGSHDYLLTVDVADQGALEAYRAHPSHAPVGKRLRAATSAFIVADIEI